MNEKIRSMLSYLYWEIKDGFLNIVDIFKKRNIVLAKIILFIFGLLAIYRNMRGYAVLFFSLFLISVMIERFRTGYWKAELHGKKHITNPNLRKYTCNNCSTINYLNPDGEVVCKNCGLQDLRKGE